MAINPYFNLHGQNGANLNEQKVVRDLVTECVQQRGMNVTYMPRQFQNVDEILHEDPTSSFSLSKVIEMFIESVDGFGGDGDMFSSFGYEMKDQITFSVSTDRFKAEFGAAEMPNEGDLIYLPLSNTLFEVSTVDHESQFYPLGTLPMITIVCEAFEYSHESFATGDVAIDSVMGLEIDPSADNVTFTNDAAAILDFTETNPFGGG